MTARPATGKSASAAKASFPNPISYFRHQGRGPPLRPQTGSPARFWRNPAGTRRRTPAQARTVAGWLDDYGHHGNPSPLDRSLFPTVKADIIRKRVGSLSPGPSTSPSTAKSWRSTRPGPCRTTIPATPAPMTRPCATPGATAASNPAKTQTRAAQNVSEFMLAQNVQYVNYIISPMSHQSSTTQKGREDSPPGLFHPGGHVLLCPPPLNITVGR